MSEPDSDSNVSNEEAATPPEMDPDSPQARAGVRTTDEADDAEAVERVAAVINWVQNAFSSSGQGFVERYGYPKFSPYFRERRDEFAEYRSTVNKARIDETYDRWLARTVTLTLLAAVSAALVGIAVGALVVVSGALSGLEINIAIDTPLSFRYPSWLLVVWATIRAPLGVVFLGVFAAVLSGAPVAAGLYYLPHFRAYERERNIDILLPQAVTFMYSLSRGDMTFPAIVRELAKRGDTYGEAADAFQAVVNNMDYFGKDLRGALREARRDTPSEELGSLLDDMISIIDSGGEIGPFLEDQVDKFQSRAADRADQELETLELVSEMFVTVGVVGMLLGVVVLVIIASISGSNFLALYAITYLAIPLVSLTFVVLIGTISMDDSSTSVSIGQQDERIPTADIKTRLAGGSKPLGTDPGAGAYGHPDEPRSGGVTAREQSVATDGGSSGILARDEAALSTILKRRSRKETVRTLKAPLAKMRREPTYTLFVTVPLVLMYLGVVSVAGLLDLRPGPFIELYRWNTTLGFVIPAVIILTPLSFFYERQVRYQRAVNEALPSTLKKLAAANKTGMTLQDSINLVANNSEDVLAGELERVSRELRFNIGLNEALTRMANRVRNPRLTRVVSLLTEASTASGSVQQVLEVASRDIEKAREIDRQRHQRLILYVAITTFSTLIFVGVAMQLSVRLVPALAEAAQATSDSSAGGGSPFGSTFNPDELKMLLFHSALVLSVSSGMVAGKLANADLLSGAKYALAQLLVTTVVFLLA